MIPRNAPGTINLARTGISRADFQPPPDWGQGGTGGGFRRYAGGDGRVHRRIRRHQVQRFLRGVFRWRTRRVCLQAAGFGRRAPSAERGQDVEADMVTLRKRSNGSRGKFFLRRSDSEKVETYRSKSRAACTKDNVFGWRGREKPVRVAGRRGDLFLRVRLARHPDFVVEGNDYRQPRRRRPCFALSSRCRRWKVIVV